MKNPAMFFFTIIFIGFSLTSCEKKVIKNHEESFLGEWYTIKGNVEAYSFLKDSSSYIFAGTQGMRPVIFGTWKIDKDRFVIKMDNGTITSYTFTLKNDTLSFNNGEEIYTRTEPLDVKHPEVKILLSISSGFKTLKFSPPIPSELKWGYHVDSTKSAHDILLSGYSISAATTLSSGVLKEISNYIKESGFDPDTLYVTEICTGFRDNIQIITLCTSQYPEAANDSVRVFITSGLFNL
jgi:hypothetical protein